MQLEIAPNGEEVVFLCPFVRVEITGLVRFTAVRVALFNAEKVVPRVVINLGEDARRVFLSSEPLLQQHIECIHMADFAQG